MITDRFDVHPLDQNFEPQYQLIALERSDRRQRGYAPLIPWLAVESKNGRKTLSITHSFFVPRQMFFFSPAIHL
jgi:hypothetical protein